MKKITLAIAVLAVLTTSLVSFTNSTTSSKDEERYVWIRMDCTNVGDPNPMIGFYETIEDGPYPLVSSFCTRSQPWKVCALQFLRTQVTCSGGVAVVNPGVSLWSDYRNIAYCTY